MRDGREPQVRIFPSLASVTDFSLQTSCCKLVQFTGGAWKRAKSRNIKFRLTSVVQKRLCLTLLSMQVLGKHGRLVSFEEVRQACKIIVSQQCCRSWLFLMGNEKDGQSVNLVVNDHLYLDSLFCSLSWIYILFIRLRNVNVSKLLPL